ncbi:MAG TPA: hypothetical protein VG755_01460 [Nannocystaceae bacterium]|nr:hypothetical protein [Nannocystaceae bacterium]
MVVADRARGWIDADEEQPAIEEPPIADDGAGETASPDAIALAEALLPASDATAQTATVPVVSELDELELRDFELEWVERGGYYYYGYGGAKDPAKALRIAAVAKVKAATGEKAEVVIKASCDDGGYTITDADISTIDDSYVTRIPAVGTDFKIAARIFNTTTPSEPSACRVTVMLRDLSRSPVRRGRFERCWTKESKRAVECTPDSLPKAVASEQGWTVADAQFLPTGELGFSVVAGHSRAPDRVAVRATCHAGDKQFVELKYLTGRWYTLEPGEGLRVREQLQSSWEFMRYADCDIEVQDVGYDFDKQSIRGMKAIAKLCSRPIGIRAGSCRTTVPEPPAPDPGGAPAKVEVQHGGSNSYMGWYNAYAMGELTVLSTVPTGATLDFVAHCGSRTEKQAITLQTPMELVYPGQTLRAQGNVSFTGKVKAKSCTTEFVLNAKDASGSPVSWPLAKQCYDKYGSYVPCPGATTPALPGLGLSGVGAGGGHRKPMPKRFR